MSRDDLHLQFIETILRGGTATSGKGIVGSSAHETQQMRAEWVAVMLPRTANLIGVEWDGIERLPRREKK